MKIEEIQKRLNNIRNSFVDNLLPEVERAAREIKTNDDIENTLIMLASDKVVEYFEKDTNKRLADATKLIAKKIFYTMAVGTEFEKYEGFGYKIDEVLEIGEFYFDIHIDKNLNVNVETYDDTLGSINDWAGALLSAREVLRKPQNDKYKNNKGYQKILPILRSNYWKNIIYSQSELFDETEELRLSFLPEDSIAFIFALESGTGGALKSLVGEGGFPTPFYSSKGNFLENLKVELDSFINSIAIDLFNKSLDRLKEDVYGIISEYGVELTDKLLTAIKKMGEVFAREIIEKSKEVDINKGIGVIINIDSRYYEIIKTKSGKLGVRYSLKENMRRRI